MSCPVLFSNSSQHITGKHYGVVYDKRIVKPDFTTVPFGYRK